MKFRGFTLIELLVTVAIFAFMTALIMSRYGAFNQGTLMTNLAYDVALAVRTAQTYGVSVKGNEYTGQQSFNQAFNYSYGVDFNTSTPNTFFIFIDGSNGSTANGAYDAGETIVSTYTIRQSAKIYALCADTAASGLSATCASSNTHMDVVFKRPDPAAIVSVNGSTMSGSNPYAYARITLVSADGSEYRNIEVRGNGQISVIK